MEDDLQARARALTDAAHDLIMEHRELRTRSDLIRRQHGAAASRLSALRQTAGLLQQLASAQHIVGAGARQIIQLRRIVADPAKHLEYVLRTSMIQSLRDAEKIQ